MAGLMTGEKCGLTLARIRLLVPKVEPGWGRYQVGRNVRLHKCEEMSVDDEAGNDVMMNQFGLSVSSCPRAAGVYLTGCRLPRALLGPGANQHHQPVAITMACPYVVFPDMHGSRICWQSGSISTLLLGLLILTLSMLH